jgi:hypothetical protein
MCSNASQSGPARAEAELAAQLAVTIDEFAVTIDELAAAASSDADAASPDIAERLVRAWAMIKAADPELAARTARY